MYKSLVISSDYYHLPFNLLQQLAILLDLEPLTADRTHQVPRLVVHMVTPPTHAHMHIHTCMHVHVTTHPEGGTQCTVEAVRLKEGLTSLPTLANTLTQLIN